MATGLVDMGGDSWSEGRGFKSQHHILDGLFHIYLLGKIVMFIWKDEDKQKKGRVWHILKNVWHSSSVLNLPRIEVD